MTKDINVIDVDKIGSATSPLGLARTVAFVSNSELTKAGDVVVVRALTDSATYNLLELPTGRLAKINPGDLLIGVLGRRRALKGFVGDVPASLKSGDQLHLLKDVRADLGHAEHLVAQHDANVIVRTFDDAIGHDLERAAHRC